MPVHITKFPSKEFDEQFEESAADVWSYFDNAHDITRAVQKYSAQQAKTQTTPTKAMAAKGRSSKSEVRRGCEPVVERLMEEYDASKSFVRQARQCGDAFEDEDVRMILGQCQEHHLLPSRDLFIQLIPVPKDDRMEFAEEMISNRYSTRTITAKRIERYGRTSKGTKKPKAPASLFEAKEQVIKEQNRVRSLGEALLTAVAAGTCDSVAAGFTAPPAAAPKIRTAIRALASLRKLLEEAVDGDSAA